MTARKPPKQPWEETPIVDHFKAMLRSTQIKNGLTMTSVGRTLEQFCHQMADPKNVNARKNWHQYCKRIMKIPVRRGNV